jgi:hypothetical protein
VRSGCVCAEQPRAPIGPAGGDGTMVWFDSFEANWRDEELAKSCVS